MTDFPEPLSFNGGPEETGGYVKRSTGVREEPEVESPRGMPCHTCGLTIHRVYTLADVGAFCSPGCRSAATNPNWKRRSA